MGPLYGRLRREPGWVAGTAFLAAALVVVIPLIVLVVTAIFVGLVVFVVLSLVAQVVAFVRAGWQRIGPGEGLAGGGRENVRVVRWDER